MTAPETMRTRTVAWNDPRVFADAMATLSGLEFLRTFVDRSLPPPPFMELLGVRMVAVGPSTVSFEFEPAEFMYSPLGNVHGGIVTVLLDSAMGCSFHTTLPAGVGYTTLELKVNFVRPVTVSDGTLRAEGHVVSAGARVATAEAQLRGVDGKLFAHATSTLLVLRPEPR